MSCFDNIYNCLDIFKAVWHSRCAKCARQMQKSKVPSLNTNNIVNALVNQQFQQMMSHCLCTIAAINKSVHMTDLHVSHSVWSSVLGEIP